MTVLAFNLLGDGLGRRSTRASAGSAGDGMRTGRAVWFTAPRRAEVLAEPVRAPGDGEVTVRTLVSLISAGTELKYYRGHAALEMNVGHPTLGGAAGYPVRFAYLCAGRVVEAGPGAPHRPGDLVYARHPHQDLFTTPVEHDGRAVVVGLPGDMDPEVAMFLNLAEVAMNALLDVPVGLGDVAVVFGQGIVGLFLAQLARRTAAGCWWSIPSRCGAGSRSRWARTPPSSPATSRPPSARPAEGGAPTSRSRRAARRGRSSRRSG